jgi:hypothetical protein
MSSKWKAFFAGDVLISQEPETKFVSDDLAAVISEHELVSCNLETQIFSCTFSLFPKAQSPHISMHVDAPELIKEAGFNVVSLATNHMYDFGAKGLKHTLNAFSDITTVGAGLDYESAYKLKVLNIKNTRVGLLSFCEAEHGAIIDESIDDGGFAWINHPSVSFRIIEAKKKVDVLIIQCHAGLERVDLPIPELRRRYREFICLGADAIIGHHPHIPQGWELYRGKPIFYCLGHFYFEYKKKHELWEKGYAVSLMFDGAQLEGYKIIPIEKTVSGVVINNDPDFKKHLDYVCGILDPEVYLDLANKQAIWAWETRYANLYAQAVTFLPHNKTLNNVRNFIRRGVKKVFKNTYVLDKHMINQLKLLHNLKIESHRWSVERALSLLNERKPQRNTRFSDIYPNSRNYINLSK